MHLSGWALVLVPVALAASAASARDAETTVMAQGVAAGPLIVDFERMEPGKRPRGFSTALTGKGAPPTWVIKEDPTAPAGPKVVTQTTSDKTSYRFPICIYDAFTGKDPELSVSFKPISGRVDQAAGLVWRYQDANNYYVVRANALEDNVVLYKMEHGKRSDLKPKDAGFLSYGKDAPVPVQRWSTLRVTVRGQQFSVWLNGEHLLDVEDETFSGPGKVGLWTKADSVTSFDFLTVQGR